MICSFHLADLQPQVTYEARVSWPATVSVKFCAESWPAHRLAVRFDSNDPIKVQVPAAIHLWLATLDSGCGEQHTNVHRYIFPSN